MSIAAQRVQKPKPKKFYGKCMRPDGSEIMLISKAYSEIAACEQLHKNYNIIMVLDLLPFEEVEARRNVHRKNLQKSSVGVPTLL